MTEKDKEQLKAEINHIFESGENEVRFFNMVVDFIDKRYTLKNPPCGCWRCLGLKEDPYKIYDED